MATLFERWHKVQVWKASTSGGSGRGTNPTFAPAPSPRANIGVQYSTELQKIYESRHVGLALGDKHTLLLFLQSGIVAVGREHVIPASSDGSQADHAGPGAAHCPAFGPLTEGGPRPAIQIRQMGTLETHRRLGNAAKVLNQLEEDAI